MTCYAANNDGHVKIPADSLKNPCDPINMYCSEFAKSIIHACVCMYMSSVYICMYMYMYSIATYIQYVCVHIYVYTYIYTL